MQMSYADYHKKEFCKMCGRPLKKTEQMCPNCGLWLDTHDGITNDEKEAARIRAEYDKSHGR
jgi:predicted amidophosphoribosyltransferase